MADLELNPQIKIISIGILFVLIIFSLPLLPHLFSEKAETNNTIIVYNNTTVYVNVTPTLDGKTYFAGEYQNGIRLLNHPFSLYWNDSLINRGIRNAQLKASVNVYDFAIFDNLFYKNLEKSNSVSNDGWDLLPMDNYSDNKLLIIYVTFETDEYVSKKSDMLSLPDANMFVVDYDNKQYYPLKYPVQVTIEQIMNKKTSDNSAYIQYFGQNAQYVGIRKQIGEENSSYWKDNDIAGVASQPHYYSIPGKSNTEDGYIIYEIPKSANPENIKVKLNYYGQGYSSWVLKNPYIYY
jgi:hypothetical protein